MFANVIIDISHEKLDRLFQYKIPVSLEDKLTVGMLVTVPFGNGNKNRSAYVLEITDRQDYPLEKMKEILEINEKSVSMEQKLIGLAHWMKNQYGCTMITAMKTVLPVKKKIKEAQSKTIIREVEKETILEWMEKCNPRRQMARLRLLEELLKVTEMPYHWATGKLAISSSVIATMEKQGIISLRTEREYRRPYIKALEKKEPITLSPQQQQAVDGILEQLKKEQKTNVLLHGITGSGKTEVYMEAIGEVLRQGKQAIVLIPEIALTFQTLRRFYEKFGDRVAVLHSRLSDGERFDQYQRAKEGKLDIMIGPRSALFTPFPNLGLIVMDEEHEPGYKSDKMPKYHAREVAEYLAKRENALLLLGSATPSLESYYKAKNGEYLLYEMPTRNATAKLPKVHTVDMREELKQGNKSLFSKKLKELLTERLVRGEQAMLFINRRGYAGFVSCRECGYVIKCPHCDVSLSQHGKRIGSGNQRESLVCHYCGYETEPVSACPSCNSKWIAGFRAGTEKIEEALKKEYPSIRILRMDGDTTKKKEDYEKILSAFSAGEADVLVGTQMIVKGHDFPNVTLVGVVAADLSLFSADYHAGERTFQLITQAAGRAGRGNKTGDVVVQTYRPDAYSIRHAANQDYKGFFEEEILYRELADYPPAKHMLAMQFYSADEMRGFQRAEALVKQIREKQEGIQIIGPSKGIIAKVNDIYRTVVYFKHADKNRLIEIKDFVETQTEHLDKGKESIQFDFDPVNMI